MTLRCFLPQNDPRAIWVRNNARKNHRTYLLHWANYDSQTNVPAVYVMEIEDTGRTSLPRDERRWPRVQSHLMAQSMSALKLVTIARGFDQDFDNLHPKFLRRFHLGPMYSHTFTQQRGPLRDILAQAQSPTGLDWALAWTVESLISKKSVTKKKGMFSSAKRQIYQINTLDGQAAKDGATLVNRSLILPHRAFQVLEEKNPPGLKRTQKYVVGKNSKILSYK